MSVLDDLIKEGASPEDIEQAAAVALFQKVAAAENIDLEAMNDDDLDATFAHFVENMLPGMLDEGAKEASTIGNQKIAEAEHAATLYLFQKRASEVDLDLETLDEAELNEAFGLFLEHDLPAMIESDKVASAYAEAEKVAEANLREMTVMGEHLADVFLAKVAGSGLFEGKEASRWKGPITTFRHARQAGHSLPEAAQWAGRAGVEQVKRNPKKSLGLGAATLAAGGAVAAKKKEASTPVFDLVARMAAAEKEASAEVTFDDLIQARVAEMLGYE